MNSKTRSVVLDPTFGEGGKVVISTPGNLRNTLFHATLNAQGQPLIFGSCRWQDPYQDQAGVCQLRDNGEPDTRFGSSGGFISVPGMPRFISANADALAVMTNGDFFITGKNRDDRLSILHYAAKGRYVAEHDLGPAERYLIADMIRHGERVLVASSHQSRGVLYGRHTDGSVDNDFGTNGEQVFITGRFLVDTLRLAPGSADGSFYVACRAGDGEEGLLLRLLANGEPDPAFAESGTYRPAIPGTRYSYCERFIALADGRLLAIVNASTGPQSSAHIIRLTSRGEFDTTFNGGEPVNVDAEACVALAVQDDGKFLVAHRDTLDPVAPNKLSRYLSDGTLDRDFTADGTGTLDIDFDANLIDFVRTVVVQPDQKIIVGGQSGDFGSAYLRYTQRA